MEEQIEILKHRIHSNFLPPAFNLLGYSLDRIEKMLNGSKQPSNMLELSIAAGEEKVQYWLILLLDHLLERNEITNEQYKQMYPNLKTLELARIYFNLKVHKHRFDSKIKHYTEKGYLTSTTLFVTFDMADLYTMIPRDDTIAALRRFCQKYSVNGKIGNLKIDTIIKLAPVVLDTNTFAYKNKYYRQIKGGAMSSPFTMVPANIYIYIYILEWEQKLMQHQNRHHEICGR
ncbi:unnamed protein product [Rotaria sordida]|uniref:Reverse transcriptase domain-containing protein n=1 Tax=Rotaria sordida TaxID=392033 RepID=A0A815MLI9_9BILA|nr:unnamed protein product [Rotaria sordida]CAF1629340.1 unnamed protein product [Rotaria sordida]